MKHDLDALTEKEKEALRLLLVGHDAKSMARALDLSVHTINDRLRYARRKLSVASSKEAARLLHEWEEGAASHPTGDPPDHAPPAPHSLASKHLGDAPIPVAEPDGQRKAGDAPLMRPALWIAGGIVMIPFVVAMLALAAPSDTPPAAAPVSEDTRPAAASQAAREWLQLVDAGDWQASYDATAGSFRSVNTLELWSSISEDVRAPLGPVTTRELLSEESIPGGPRGYHLVRFRTSFANRPDATETLSLDREDGAWKVAGIFIE